MNILCPNCHSSIPSSGNEPSLKCSQCELEINLSQVGTFPGMASMPLVRDLTGETLGPYELMDLIGVGGMGVVYKAKTLDDGKMVALKVLYCDYLRKADFVARFEREARTLLRLDNPNIIKILGSGQQDGIYYLATELIEGVTLAQRLRSGDIDFKDVIRIMTQVCSAIAYAHRQGIIHRDIKPANIVLSNGSVKVLDFGLAHLTGGDSQFSSLTRTDLAMGTLNYLSPEQRMNAKAVDERSDIFSLGVVFYEMLTDSLPLGSFVPPSKTGGRIPAKCDRVVEKSLNVIPAQRYQRVEEILKELQLLEKTGFARTRFWIWALVVAALGMGALFFWPHSLFLQDPALKEKSRVGTQKNMKVSQTKPLAVQKPVIEKKATGEINLNREVKQPSDIGKVKSKPTGKATSGEKRYFSTANKIKRPTAPLKDITIYREPNLSSPIIQKRAEIDDYEILESEQIGRKGSRWLLIRTSDGRKGWILQSE